MEFPWIEHDRGLLTALQARGRRFRQQGRGRRRGGARPPAVKRQAEPGQARGVDDVGGVAPGRLRRRGARQATGERPA